MLLITIKFLDPCKVANPLGGTHFQKKIPRNHHPKPEIFKIKTY